MRVEFLFVRGLWWLCWGAVSYCLVGLVAAGGCVWCFYSFIYKHGAVAPEQDPCGNHCRKRDVPSMEPILPNPKALTPSSHDLKPIHPKLKP